MNLKTLFLRTIVFFPFNIISLATYHALKRAGMRYSAFFDNDTAKQNVVYDGIAIEAPRAVAGAVSTVIVCTWLSRTPVKKQLAELGITQIIDYNEVWDEISPVDALNDIREDEIQKSLPEVFRKLIAKDFELQKSFIPQKARSTSAFIIPTLNLRISSWCSLKCKDCISLMQYYENPRHFDHAVTKKSFERFMSFVDYCGFLTIMGGEPLMYKKLYDVIEYTGKLKNIGAIMLVTNGTILPDEKLIKALREYGVYVRISNYGKLSVKIVELAALFAKNSIHYHIYDYTTGWLDCNKIVDSASRNDEDTQKTFLNCNISCPSFIENKFYICEFMAFADDLRAIPDNCENYIDIENPNLSKKTIQNYINRVEENSRSKPFSGCRYCSGSRRFNDSNARMVPVAEQIEKPLSYKHFTRSHV